MSTFERDVEVRLRLELARLTPLNPFEILRLSVDASPEQIRAAFLSATKEFHPNRFARESADTVEAANEIFLLIRRAYGQLHDEAKRQALRQKLGRGYGPVTPTKGMPRSLEAAPPPVNAPSSLTPVFGTPIVSAPPPRSSAIPPTQPPAGPPPTRTSGTQPPSGPPPVAAPSARAIPPTQPPVGPPSRAPGTQPPSGPPPVTRTASVAPPTARTTQVAPTAGRPAPAPLTPPRAPAPASPPTSVAPPVAPPAFSPRPRPSPSPPMVPAGAAPAPPKVSPQTSPQTGRSSAEVRALLESAKTRSQRFELAVRHMQKGRVREAKLILNELVGEDPQSRRYRVKLHHAMALELRDEGKLDEAIRELERAVALDNEAYDVADLLKKVTAERGRGGIFSRIFGR